MGTWRISYDLVYNTVGSFPEVDLDSMGRIDRMLLTRSKSCLKIP